MVWIVILLIIVAFYVYVEYTPKDVDPEFLTSQASFSATRVSGETAVYRSLVNEHGRGLLGSAPPLSKFTLSHLWSDLARFRITHVNQTGFLHDVKDFKRLVKAIQRSIATLAPGSRVPISFGTSVEGLAAFMAITLSGRIPVLLKSHTHGDHDDEEQAVVSENEFQFGKGSTGIKIHMPDCEPELIPLFSDAVEDEEEPEVVSLGGGTALISNDTSISEVDLGVSIAAQLTALGAQHRWSAKDTVFMAPGSMTVSTIVHMLTALSSGASLLFAETCPTLSAATILSTAKPTIMISDDVSMRTLSKIADDFRVFEWARYGLLRLRLAKGKLGPRGMVPGFSSLRLVHSATGPDPYQWLSNSEAASLRVLTGVQLLHVYTPDSGLPVSQTSIGDYRSGKLPGVNMGPPLPGLEIKMHGGDLLVRAANHEKFDKISNQCSEAAKLGSDGCLYVPEKRHDFSNYYYYTGELK